MNFRFTFVLVVALIVVGGAVWVMQSGRSFEPAKRVPWLWKVDLLDINHVSVTHGGEEVSYREVGDQWVIEDGNDTPVFRDKWSGMTLILSGPRANRFLFEAVDDPAAYGLDPPKTVVKVRNRSGQLVEFHLGDLTPNEANQYIRLSEGSLWSIPSLWGSVVSKLVTEPPYPPPFLSTLGLDQIGAFTVTSGGESVFYTLDEEDEWVVAGAGDIAPVDQQRWQALTQAFNGQASNNLGEPEDDDLTVYGLSPPSAILEIEPHRSEPVKFYLGGPTPDGEGAYLSQLGSDDLSTVDRDWAELVASLVADPPIPTSSSTDAS